MKNLILILVITPTLLFGQGWEKTYDFNVSDAGSSIQITTDGGYIIAGFTGSVDIPDARVLLIKTDENGDTLWTKSYGGIYDDDVGRSVQQCTDGGYIVAGSTSSFGNGSWDVYLIKTDPNGDTLWTRTFGGNTDDYGYSVQQCTDGGYIIVGETSSFGNGSYDVYMIKTDSNGDTLWTKTLGDTLYNGGYSVQQCADGGYIVAGGTSIGGTGFYDDFGYLIKTDENGDTLWTKVLMDNNGARSVQQCTDGGYIVAGSSGVEMHSDVSLIKTDENGDALWAKTFGSILYDEGYSVQQCTDGGYIVVGSAVNKFGYDNNVYLIKTDSNGDTLWTKTFGGDEYEYGYSVQQCDDGGYIITGKKGSGISDVYLIKTDEYGIVTSITEVPDTNYPKKLIKIIDISGKEILSPKKNQLYIEIYDDGTTQKKIIIK